MPLIDATSEEVQMLFDHERGMPEMLGMQIFEDEGMLYLLADDTAILDRLTNMDTGCWHSYTLAPRHWRGLRADWRDRG